MRGIVFVGIACGLLCGASAARADYAFSGSGSSGTLVNSGQTWQIKPATTSTLASWSSSPFVYDEPDEAFAIKLTFSFTGQGTLDNEALAVGETSGCNGNPGATVFCGHEGCAVSMFTLDEPESIRDSGMNPEIDTDSLAVARIDMLSMSKSFPDVAVSRSSLRAQQCSLLS